MIREQPVQTSLDDPTWPCPVCQMTGRNPKQPTTACYFCQGARLIPFDPHDYSEIPF